MGFILNRLNISITGMEAWAGVSYFPSWMEIMVTVSIVTFGFVIFAMAARYLPVFKHEAQSNHLPEYDEFTRDLEMVSRGTHQELYNEISSR